MAENQRVRVDFNRLHADGRLSMSSRFTPSLQVGEKVFAYTDDDDPRFGADAVVVEEVPTPNGPSIYVLQVDTSSYVDF